MDPSVIRWHAEVEERHWWFRARRTILRDLLSVVLAPSRDDLVVDIGCGTGANAAALAADYQVVGFDPSEDAIALARSRFPKVDFVVGAATELAPTLRDARAVLLTDVIEHVEDDAAFLSSIVPYLPPGAHVLITVPARPDLWSRHDEMHHHFRRYTHDRLEHAWSGRAVHVRLLSHYNARLLPLVVASRRLSRALPFATGEQRVPPRPVNRLLERIFAGERVRLGRALEGSGRGYSDGLSLIAILQRVDGAPQDTFSPQRSAR